MRIAFGNARNAINSSLLAQRDAQSNWYFMSTEKLPIENNIAKRLPSKKTPQKA
jgi:hypothetical protein